MFHLRYLDISFTIYIFYIMYFIIPLLFKILAVLIMT